MVPSRKRPQQDENEDRIRVNLWNHYYTSRPNFTALLNGLANIHTYCYRTAKVVGSNSTRFQIFVWISPEYACFFFLENSVKYCVDSANTQRFRWVKPKLIFIIFRQISIYSCNRKVCYHGVNGSGRLVFTMDLYYHGGTMVLLCHLFSYRSTGRLACLFAQ